MFEANSSKFIHLLATCSEWVQKDLDNCIKARVADESYLNKYIVEYPTIKVLDASYLCPLTLVSFVRPKIILRDKSFINADAQKHITWKSKYKFKLYRLLHIEDFKILWHRLNGWC